MWSAAAMIALLFMASTLVTPLYVLYQRAFGFSTLALTLIYSGYVVGNLLGLLFLGRLSDTLGRRPVILAAIAVAGASTVAFLLAADTAWLFWGRVLSGVAVALASAAGTAWLAELVAAQDKSRAALVATSANFLGLAAGSLTAGLLAQYAPAPLKLPFVAYGAALLVLFGFIATTPETVSCRTGTLQGLLAPRVGVPASIIASFATPAITGLATFSVIGFYSALAPSVLGQRLHVDNVALAGTVVAELFVVSTLAMLITAKVAAPRAMLAGLALFIPGLALLVLAEMQASLALLLTATAFIGVAAGLGYRGSLQVVNRVAPAERRAEVISSYFIACFTGNSVPVIGVGWLSLAHGLSFAITLFSIVIGAFVLTALAVTMLARR